MEQKLFESKIAIKGTVDFLWQIRTARAFRALYQVLVVFLATTLKFKFKQSQCLKKFPHRLDS